jgi:hypothetical protein
MDSNEKPVKRISELTGKELSKLTADFNNVLHADVLPLILNAFDSYKDGDYKSIPIYLKPLVNQIIKKLNKPKKTYQLNLL